MINIIKLRLTLSIILSIFAISITAAEHKKNNETSSLDSIEKIQIRGIRGSIVKSIENKRNNNAIVDAITAEDIGKFPDKNVAESLQRITGVSLTRAQGEGERISVRGTAPSQNRTYINGQNIASADWWISSLPNRAFNYTLLPSEIVSSLEVYKSPEANHDEGSLGGSIDIKTHSPLETKDNMFVGTAQLQYSDVSNKTDPQVSLFYNQINDAKDLGVLISLTRHERNLRRDGLESWSWAERNYNKTAEGGLKLTEEDEADHTKIWSPGGGGSTVFQQERELSSAMVIVQYQPNNDWNIELNSLYSVLSADNSNQNFLWQASSVYERDGHITDYTIIDDTLVQSTYSKVPTDNSQGIPFSASMEAIWRKSKIETSLVHLLADHSVDYWQMKYQIGFTKASADISKDFTSQWSANTAFSVDLQTPKNVITQYDVDPLSAKDWHISDVRQDAQNSDDSELFLQADFEYQLDHVFIQSLKFGGKYKQHQRDFKRLRSKNGGYNGLAGSLNWTLAEFQTSFPNNYLHGIGSEQTLKEYAFADISKLNTAFQTLPLTQSEEKPSSFDIKESTFAAYGKINFEGEYYRGNMGVRLVRTQQDSAAFEKSSISENGGIYEDYIWTGITKNYTDFLPSINIVVDLDDDILLRLAASKVMSRPEYHHLMPSTNYNVTQAQGAGGNPDLDPFRATNFDIGVEWYFDEASLFSAAAFHKDIQSFIDIKRSQEVYENINMVINRPINGSGGTINGLELNLQKELFYGFGVIANYTYVDGKRKELLTNKNINIPGNSKHSTNLTTYFENDWVSSRFSYNFRTEFATGVGEEITDDYGQWDVNVSFILTESLSLVFEAINLTDEIIYTYERNKFSPVGIYKNGRRFYAGVRVSL